MCSPEKGRNVHFIFFLLSVRCFHLRVQTSFWNLPPLDASNKSHNMILIISFGSISNLHRDGCLFVMLFTVFILRPKRSGRISTIGEEITIWEKKWDIKESEEKKKCLHKYKYRCMYLVKGLLCVFKFTKHLIAISSGQKSLNSQ